MKKIILLMSLVLILTASCTKYNSLLTKTKWVYYENDESKNIQVDLNDPSNKPIYYDTHYLVLNENGNVKTYRNSEKMPYDDYNILASEYIKGKNSPYLSILEFKNNKFTVAPYNYDADANNNYKEYITEIDAADSVSFLSVDYKNDNGNESIECRNLSETDYKDIGEFHHTGYLNFNNEGKVTSIVFYGEVIIEG